MRCAIYGRVSTKDKGQEVENQLRQLREFAGTQGWSIVREYIDRETGSTGDRDQFKAMFEDASRRRFDCVLFWSLDRLTREGTLETLQYLNRLAAYGVGYRSFTEAYLDSTGLWKDAIISILATIAKQERLRISERTRAGLERARRQGKILGRPKVDVDARQIEALRASGLSWTAIAAQTGIARATCQRAVRDQGGAPRSGERAAQCPKAA
jgi:DNA invertase Pin-like site-specific DNA recombinase